MQYNAMKYNTMQCNRHTNNNLVVHDGDWYNTVSNVGNGVQKDIQSMLEFYRSYIQSLFKLPVHVTSKIINTMKY